jgi:hypothetical protein
MDLMKKDKAILFFFQQQYNARIKKEGKVN